MKAIQTISILLITLLLSVNVLGSSSPLVNGTIHFDGALNYIDYSSGKEVKIPMQLTFMQSADNKHLIVDKVYTDPGFKVYSLSVMKIEIENKQIVETTFDRNGASEQIFDIIKFDYKSAEEWSLERRTFKQDNNKEAALTVIDKMQNGEFTTETLVDYTETTENEKLKRNWVVANQVSQ